MARIKLKNSQVKDKVPQPADLDVGGELGVNHHADNPGLFLKDTAGNIRKIAGPNSISTSPATESAAGVVELATIAETTAGTDNSRAVHPAGLKALLAASLTPGSTTPPATPATGTTYVDSSVTPAVITIWNGTTWVPQTGTAVKGNTAPTAPATGQLWLDQSTSPAVNRIWDGTNWVAMTVDTGTQAKLDQQLSALWSRSGTVVSPANAGDQVHTATGKLTVGGTAAAPAVSLDPGTTGSPLVRDSSGRVGIGDSAPGTFDVRGAKLTLADSTSDGIGIKGKKDSLDRWYVGYNSSDQLEINQIRNNALAFKTNNTEVARLTNSGQLLVGTSTSVQVYQGATAFNSETQVAGSSASLTIARSIGPGNLFLARNQTVNNGSSLGVISFNGGDGTNLIQAAQISAEVDGTPGANDMPGRLVFSTTAAGASSPTERMRITSKGFVAIGTSSATELLNVNGHSFTGSAEYYTAARSRVDGATWYKKRGTARPSSGQKGRATITFSMSSGDPNAFHKVRVAQAGHLTAAFYEFLVAESSGTFSIVNDNTAYNKAQFTISMSSPVLTIDTETVPADWGSMTIEVETFEMGDADITLAMSVV